MQMKNRAARQLRQGIATLEGSLVVCLLASGCAVEDTSQLADSEDVVIQSHSQASFYTRSVDYHPNVTSRPITCGSTVGLNPPTVQVIDASFPWTDPATGHTDWYGAADWFEVRNVTSRGGTVYAELAFIKNGDPNLFAWLAAAHVVINVVLVSEDYFTVRATFSN
jgi:hypothetical protein